MDRMAGVTSNAIDAMNSALDTSLAHFFSVNSNMTIGERTPLLAAAQQEHQRQRKAEKYHRDIIMRIGELEEEKKKEKEEEEMTQESEESDSDESCPGLEDVPIDELPNKKPMGVFPQFPTMPWQPEHLAFFEAVKAARASKSTSPSPSESTQVVKIRSSSTSSIEVIEEWDPANFDFVNMGPIDTKGVLFEHANFEFLGKPSKTEVLSQASHSRSSSIEIIDRSLSPVASSTLHMFDVSSAENEEMVAENVDDVIEDRAVSPKSEYAWGEVIDVDVSIKDDDVITKVMAPATQSVYECELETDEGEPTFKIYKSRGMMRIELKNWTLEEETKMFSRIQGSLNVEILRHLKANASIYGPDGRLKDQAKIEEEAEESTQDESDFESVNGEDEEESDDFDSASEDEEKEVLNLVLNADNKEDEQKTQTAAVNKKEDAIKAKNEEIEKMLQQLINKQEEMVGTECLNKKIELLDEILNSMAEDWFQNL